MQRIERSQTAQIQSGTLGKTGGLVGGCQGRDHVKVLCVEGIAGDERNRVCLLGRSEEFMPDIREFYKYKTSKQVMLFFRR